eukprot:7336143-Ditylum_brightwellii.AAC.2
MRWQTCDPVLLKLANILKPAINQSRSLQKTSHFHRTPLGKCKSWQRVALQVTSCLLSGLLTMEQLQQLPK